MSNLFLNPRDWGKEWGLNYCQSQGSPKKTFFGQLVCALEQLVRTKIKKILFLVPRASDLWEVKKLCM